MAQKRGSARDARGMQRPETEGTGRATLGEGVLINGVDAEAGRRAHMRGLTTARQTAEQGPSRGWLRAYLPEPTATERLQAHQMHTAATDAAFIEIEAAHQTWLRAQEVLAAPVG